MTVWKGNITETWTLNSQALEIEFERQGSQLYISLFLVFSPHLNLNLTSS